MKTINNNSLNLSNVGQNVTLFGWVQKKRDLGGLIFIDLRDRSGIVQLVIRPEDSFYEDALRTKNEYVLKVEGNVVERENKNQNISTGEIEVEVKKFDILNESSDLPIDLLDEDKTLEDTRLKYRYLDIRRKKIKDNLVLRHKVVSTARKYFDEANFIEVETPILCRSTPEGARDYVVPSRINKGEFYALPQSPQIYKQLLMVGGIERYFQIARCFRDEDLRADRQPEFSQIDVEMSFIEEIDIQTMIEGLFKKIFKEVKDMDINTPFIRIKYDDAMAMYGSDKPDTRFDMKLINFNEVFQNTNFTIFKDALNDGKIIKGIVVKSKASEISRKVIDEFNEFVKIYKAQGLFFLKYENDNFDGGITKFLTEEEFLNIKSLTNIENGDIILFVADKKKIVEASLGALRCNIARKYNLIDKNKYNFLWVVDFPLFEYSEEDNRFYAMHHPFTSPKDSDVDKLISDPGHCYAKAYDIVLNGYEVGGGSIRIHNSDVQKKMFEALSMSDEEAIAKFGYLINAFKYGVPPHGGLALGLERLVMLLASTDNIKDVMAFPKTSSASCLMVETPNTIDDCQLKELGIKIEK